MHGLCVHVYMYVHTYVRMCLCMGYVYMYVCTYIRMYICVNAWAMRTCMYVRTVHAYVRMC